MNDNPTVTVRASTVRPETIERMRRTEADEPPDEPGWFSFVRGDATATITKIDNKGGADT